MPAAFEGFAANQPISQAIDAIRALLLGEPVGSHAWITLIWCLSIAVLSATITGALFSRKFS
jgi:ABC-2 type transport system permease protein